MKNKLAKIAVTVEADQALDDMLIKVNTGFQGGKDGKQELASWAIKHLAESGIDGFVEAIRAAHFDELAYLGSVLKELRAARRNGRADADIRAMLAPLVGPEPKIRGGRAQRLPATDTVKSSERTPND